MGYKLLIVDIDTFLNEKSLINYRTSTSLLRVQQLGVRLALASEKALQEILSATKNLMLEKYQGYLIANSYQLLFDVQANKVLYNQTKSNKQNALDVLFELMNTEIKSSLIITNRANNNSTPKIDEFDINSIKQYADIVPELEGKASIVEIIDRYFFSKEALQNIDLDCLNKTSKNTLMESLGIKYTHIDKGRVEAIMPANDSNCQPFGILHGGATVALAETVAGFGSLVIVRPDEVPVGMQISANHISMANKGDTVKAKATLVHKGHSSHIWNVDIFAQTDKLISSVRVLNSIIRRK